MRIGSLVLLLSCVNVGFAQDPAKIAVVRTWGDLVNQPLLTLTNGSRVRIGLEARDATRNSAFLAYALLEGTRWQTHGSDPLGPLNVELSPDHRSHKQRITPGKHSLRENDVQQFLFMVAIPVGKAGKYDFVLRGPDDAIVAVGTINVGDKLPDPWSAFGRPQELRQRLLDRDGIVREINLVVQKAVPAMPRSDGQFPVMACPVAGKERPLTDLLPRWSFDRPDPRLKLQADVDTLRIESEMEMDHGYPRLHWLCRVWVNGKLYVPELDEPIWSKTRPVDIRGKKLHMEWKLDPKHLGAKKGDRIAVQLIYCHDGWQDVSSNNLGWTISSEKDWSTVRPRVPILTNKAEFVCP